MKYQIRHATTDDIYPALDLALRVFTEYEAPEYPPEGLPHFIADIEAKKQSLDMYQLGQRLMIIAQDGNKIIGMLESTAKNNNGHINTLFVDGVYHRQGIATALMENMVCVLKLRGYNKITVNSSPYGLPFYQHFGFIPTEPEQTKNGFIFTPMVYKPNEIWDVLDENGNKTDRFHERGRKMATGGKMENKNK